MAVPFLVGVSWQYARHPARGTVSGGGPPPHFNNLRDNLEIRAQRAGTAYTATPARFRHRRPTPPKLPTIAWINPPTPEAVITSA